MEARAGLGIATIAVLAGELVPDGAAAVAALLALATIGAIVARRRRVLLAIALALTGFTAGALRMRAARVPPADPDHVARLALPLRTTLVGRIVAPPERRGRRIVLLVAAETVGRGARRRPASGLVRVGVRRPTRRWRYGERLTADVTLRRPRNFENPGSFDWTDELARRNVFVTASVWDPRDVERLPARVRGVRARLERWRTRIAARIRRAVPEPERGVLTALLVGDQDAVAPDIRDAFTRAGVVHVLSISGLHVGLVAAAGFAVASWLVARSERALLAVDVRRVGAVCSLVPVLVYTALAGLGVATLRSAIMVAAAATATLVGRRVDVLRTLALAALAVALAWPGTPRDASFQLSFVSVLALVCGLRRLATAWPIASPRAARLRDALAVSPCALVGTAPLTAFHFHQVSLVGVVANPLVVPIFGAAVVIVGLAGVALEPVAPGGATALFRVAGLVLRPGIGLVQRLARPAWAAVDVPIPTIVELVVVYAALGALLLLPRRSARALLVVALVGLAADAAWWTHERIGRTSVRVTFLDVGQGDAAVAELPGGRVLVVDAGGFPGGDFDTGAAVVSPFLLGRKMLVLDAVAMTHAHPDHSGGLPYLLVHHRPGAFWWTGVPGDGAEWERLAGTLAATATPAPVVNATARPWALGGFVEVLHPRGDEGRMSLNDSSLTLRLGLGAFAALLTGDIESRAERALLAAPSRLRADVLKVPHHGSRTSSTPAFVDAVRPRIAVISVGADNRYRLPSPEVEARYRARGACVLRTDVCGAVTVESDGDRLAVETVRGCSCGATPPW